MQGKLESQFFSFVRHLRGAELLDDLKLTPAQRAGKRADVFFNERRVIGEVKLLATNTAPKIEAILKPFEETEQWPVFYGERSISQILEHLPEPESLKCKVYDAVAGSLEYLVRDANRQVRETKKSFGLTNARGLLVVLNDTIDVLDPNVMAHKIGQTLLKKDGHGAARFPNIEFAWLLCETHATPVAGTNALLSVIIQNPRVPPDLQLAEFMDSLQEKWAEFNLMPMFRTTMPIQELSQIELQAISASPGPTQITRSELWRRQYGATPTLRALSRDELLDHGITLIDSAGKLFAKGGPSATPEQMEHLGRETTSFFEEIAFRNIDMRELAQRRAAKGE